MSEDSTTQCLLFPGIFRKPVVAQFDQREGSSDGGALLLKAADRHYGLVAGPASCLRDERQAGKVDHSLRELVGQRAFSMACGYPDANDSARLSEDPIHKLLLDRDPIEGRDLASQSTLSRFENGVGVKELYRAGEFLAESVIRRHAKRLRHRAYRVTIDLDPTDDPTHGAQQLSFFNGYYDTWCYLPVMAAEAGQVLHVLDRFHITTHLNQAVDQVRRRESTRLRAEGEAAAQRLKHMRWTLLRRGSRVRGRARQKLQALLVSKLATARAWELKETFQHLWHYRSLLWARTFLDYWCVRAMRSRLEPMKKVARMLRAHEELLLNWFRAKAEISSGAVEGLNNKIRVVTRRSYGFRTYEAMEIALYHTLGRLPEPETTHRFC